MMGSMMRRAMIGDSATLNVDFTSMTNGGQLANAGFTFTNATTTARTYINSSGLVATATTNEPRFDHDPTTRAPMGLLIEATATNYLPFSQGLAGTGWFTGGICTRTQNYATGPDGVANSATRLEMSYSGGEGRTYYASSYTTLPHTNSVWLKSNTGSNQTVRLWNTSGTPVTCTVTPTWQRFQSVSATGTSLPGYFYLENPSSTVAVDILAWGAQLEAGSGASSYIPTGASTVTRLADECQLLDLTTMGFNASAGTIFVDMGARISTGSNRSYTFLPASGGNNQIFEGSGVAFQVFSGGSFVAQIGTSTSAAQKIASAYAVNDYAVSVNGGAVATDTSGALPTSLTKLTLGGSIINTAAYQFGCIRTFKYWPTRLPNAQLQSLTT